MFIFTYQRILIFRFPQIYKKNGLIFNFNEFIYHKITLFTLDIRLL